VPIEWQESETGKLKIFNLAYPTIPPRPVEEKYTGEFIPDLKDGDEVAIIDHDHGDALYVVKVGTVDARFIYVTSASRFGQFNREGQDTSNPRYEIWRIATDEDRQRAAVWEENQRELQRVREEKRQELLRAQQAAREEKDRQRAVTQQRVEELLSRLPANIHVSAGEVYDSGISLELERTTLEQLERIVEALQPAPALAE